ncbi:zinc-dependent metalloprotease [Flavobacteriales bacterium]|jgi:hypothetical protein|nr:zinc-dependent metalloprotease [Flavobacteriales bacterium]
MAYPRFLLFFFLLCTFGVSAQLVADQVTLMEAKNLPHSLSPTLEAASARGLKLDAAAFLDLKAAAPERFTWLVPFPDGTLKTLRFRRFENLSEHMEIAVNDANGFHSVDIQPSLVTYELEGGEAQGTLILMKDHVMASFSMDGRRWEINHRGEGWHALFPIDASTDDRIFSCGVEDAAPLALGGGAAAQMSSSSLLECVEVGIEIDQFTYSALGSDVTDAVDWALAILAAVDQIYRNELNDLITLEARFIHVWTSPDPYASVVNDGGGLLGAFNSEWNNNPNFNAIPLDLKHFFTMRTNIGTGGIAYLNGLCNSFNAGVSGNLTGTTSYNINTYAWNLDVVAHEMGHNCGANHTHWCGWPGGPIDNCGSYEGDCTGYTNNPTGQLGTIMSYCHAIAGGSKLLQFHPTVENNALIPTFNNASCIGTCGDLVTETTGLFCGDSQACNYSPGDINNDGCVYPDACSDCGPDGGLIGGLAVPELVTSLAGGGIESTTFSASGTPLGLNITVVFGNAQSSGSWPGDMLLGICSPSGDCIEIGGYDQSQGYTGAGTWPGSWNVSASGTYTASVNLGSTPLAGDGIWTIEVMNAWSTSGVVNYTVNAELPGLCSNNTDVTGCMDPAACNYDENATVDDGGCLYDDALGICGGDCGADSNNNGICDDEEACGDAACGEGTYWNAATGLCVTIQMQCLSDVDFDGLVTVTDILMTLGSFGEVCPPLPPPATACGGVMCCDEDACGTGTVWDADLGKCTADLNHCPGDIDFDGIVTVSDILGVLAGFGEACD